MALPRRPIRKACGKKQIGAGHPVGDFREIVGAAGLDARQRHTVGGGNLLHITQNLTDKHRVADQRRHLGEHLHPCLAAEGLRRLLGNLFHAGRQKRPAFFGIGADAALQHGGIGNDVKGRTRCKAPHGQGRAVCGVAFSGNQLLQRRVDMHGDVDGVNGHMGVCAVGSFALHRNAEAVTGIHHGAPVIIEIAPRRSAGPHMEGQGRVHPGVFQNPRSDHILSALKGLLRRLEHELDRSFQFLFLLFQHPGSRQQHGGMEVMAAGVGFLPRGTGKGQAALLRHGQGVHIRPQKQHSAAAADGGGNAMTAPPGRNAVLPQFFIDILDRLGQIQSHFRVGMEVSAVVYRVLIQFLRPFPKIHGNSS